MSAPRAPYRVGKIPVDKLTVKRLVRIYSKVHSNRKSKVNYVPPTRLERLIKIYLKTFAECITFSKEGMYLQELGYFGILEFSNSTHGVGWCDGEEKVYLNPHTKGRVYGISYIPIDVKNIFAHWTFDGSFVQPVKSRLHKELIAGKRYRFNATLFINSKLKDENKAN